jgi:hypothetical protein
MKPTKPVQAMELRSIQYPRCWATSQEDDLRLEVMAAALGSVVAACAVRPEALPVPRHMVGARPGALLTGAAGRAPGSARNERD